MSNPKFWALNPPDQYADNVFKMRDADTLCCGSNTDACQWASQAITNAHVVNAFHYTTPAGEAKAVVFSPALSTNAAVVAAIQAELLANGFDKDTGPAVFVVQGDTTKVVYINAVGLTATKLVVNTNVDRTFACNGDEGTWEEPA